MVAATTNETVGEVEVLDWKHYTLGTGVFLVFFSVVALNITFLVTFHRLRRQLFFRNSSAVICLISTDLANAIMMTATLLTWFYVPAPQPYIMCLLKSLPFMLSNYTSLLNMTVFCIWRLFVIRRVSKGRLMAKVQGKRYGWTTVGIWFISALVIGVSYATMGRFNAVLMDCRRSLFSDIKGSLLYFSIAFDIPLIIMNVCLLLVAVFVQRLEIKVGITVEHDITAPSSKPVFNQFSMFVKHSADNGARKASSVSSTPITARFPALAKDVISSHQTTNRIEGSSNEKPIFGDLDSSESKDRNDDFICDSCTLDINGTAVLTNNSLDSEIQRAPTSAEVIRDYNLINSKDNCTCERIPREKIKSTNATKYSKHSVFTSIPISNRRRSENDMWNQNESNLSCRPIKMSCNKSVLCNPTGQSTDDRTSHLSSTPSANHAYTLNYGHSTWKPHSKFVVHELKQCKYAVKHLSLEQI